MKACPYYIAALLAIACVGQLKADPQYPNMGPDIYDVNANGSDQIEAAIWKAKAEHKHILLDLGANWCIWCRRLHATFENNPEVSKALRDGFVLVMVDVNQKGSYPRNKDVNARYKNPIEHGIPVLVVLDGDGKYMVTKDSGDFEEGQGHNPAKILNFLKAWAPVGH